MEKTSITTPQVPKALGPYSSGIRIGNLFFTAQSGADKDGTLATDFSKQAEQCLKNIKAVIEEAGGMMDDIVKCTIYLTNIDNFSIVNDVYASFFKNPYPSRICMEVSKFPGGENMNIEIDIIAHIE